MPIPRLLIAPLLLAVAACASPAPRQAAAAPEHPAPAAQPAASPENVVAAMTERCRATVGNHPNASVAGEPTAARMRDDWVQVDGIVEWRGESGRVARNAWTCDMFRGEDGVWRRRYLSFGPA